MGYNDDEVEESGCHAYSMESPVIGELRAPFGREGREPVFVDPAPLSCACVRVAELPRLERGGLAQWTGK